MATANDVQFLFSCIRYTDGGKVDFEAVRIECGIVTKGAAAKRYQRLREKFGTIDLANSDATSVNAGDPAAATEAATPKTKTKAKVTKKRKLKDEDEDQLAVKAEEE